MVIKIIYTVFLGLLVALFVGVGIAAFYPAPKPPEYPVALEKGPPPVSETTETAAQKAERVKYEKALEKNREADKAFQKKNAIYSRNASIISLVAAILVLIISLTLLTKIPILSDGLLLGGVLTVLYSIILGFGSDDEKYRFILVSVGLIIALVLGYIKFIKPSTETKPAATA